MKTYSVHLGVVENAMLREILKKNPSQQEVARFLLRMIAQEYKRMFPNSSIWGEALVLMLIGLMCMCFYALSAGVELAGTQDLSHFWAQNWYIPAKVEGCSSSNSPQLDNEVMSWSSGYISWYNFLVWSGTINPQKVRSWESKSFWSDSVVKRCSWTWKQRSRHSESE